MLIQLLRSVRVTLPSVATCPGDSSAATSSGNTASSTMMGSSTMTGSSMSNTRTADTVADAVTAAESMDSTATNSVAPPAAATPATGAGRQLVASGIGAGAAMLGLALL
ncbi:MAG: hypothetical protein L6R35_003068 [Caloplaca aegaea]|nr:MAG: hypothetical protein L6R35_003068 [Caloplaca aegaea]